MPYIRITSRDIEKLQKIGMMLECYAMDRKDYDLKESKEAKKLSKFLGRFVEKLLE